MKKTLRIIDRSVLRIEEAITSASLVILLLLLLAQIVGRFFRIQAIAPPDEIMTLLFAWLVFLASASLVRHDDHLRVELIDTIIRRHPRFWPWYRLTVAIIQGFFLLVLARSSIQLYVGAGTRRSPMLGLPQRYWYAAVLVSALLMAVYTVEKIISSILALKGQDDKSA
jgi:TRAP-type transport system small permease protein